MSSGKARVVMIRLVVDGLTFAVSSRGVGLLVTSIAPALAGLAVGLDMLWCSQKQEVQSQSRCFDFCRVHTKVTSWH